MPVLSVDSLVNSQQDGVRHAALTLALGIIMERVKSLPQEDRQDLYELAKGFPQAQTGEEIESIFAAIMEILDQKPGRVLAMDDAREPTEGLQRWMSCVSERIRETRENAGMTQCELADKSGLPQSHISRIETGKHSPSHSTLEKLAKALNVPLTTFDPSAT